MCACASLSRDPASNGVLPIVTFVSVIIWFQDHTPVLAQDPAVDQPSSMLAYLISAGLVETGYTSS